MGGEGRTSHMAIVNFAWIKARVKARLLDDPNHPDQQVVTYVSPIEVFANGIKILVGKNKMCTY